MTVFALLLLYWVASGLTIAIYDAIDRAQAWTLEGGGPGARTTDWAAGAAPIPDPHGLGGIAAALRAAQDMPIASVDMRMADGRPQLQLAEADGDRAAMQRFDAGTGNPAVEAERDARFAAWRNLLKSWHRGNIAGLPGQFAGLLTGLALVALMASGTLIYAKMYQSRRRIGKAGPFWRSRDSRWRRLHRWTSTVAAVFILNIALSGIVLAAAEIKLAFFLQYHVGTPPYPKPGALPPLSRGPLQIDIAAALDRAYSAGAVARIGAPIVGIALVRNGAASHALVTFGGRTPTIRAFDTLSGRSVADPATIGVQVGQGYYADWHQIVKRLHRGDIIGSFAGRYVDIAAGLALLYLTVSGIVLYLQLHGQRGPGRRRYFWR